MSPAAFPPDWSGAGLDVQRDGAIVTLTFNRPGALNALDAPMAQALLATARSLAEDRRVRAVVMRGAGKGFMAGGDLATLRNDPVGGAASLIGPVHQAVQILHGLDAPLIAQVHGVAAGAGMSFMLHADFVLMAEGTRLNTAFVNLGASCDTGTSWILPRLVGLRRALELAMLGDTLDAAQALQYGLVNRVVPAEQLQDETLALARRLASGPTAAYGAIRRLMRESLSRSLPEQLDAEARDFVSCAATADFRAGVEAFYAKTRPAFDGRRAD